jgi:hypothetical protein
MRLVWELVHGEGLAKGKKVPVNILLGSDAYDVVTKTYKQALTEMDDWKEFALSTMH